MKLEWMGENRELMRALIRYANLYAHGQADRLAYGEGTALSGQEWQTLECILEFEGENYNMATLADRLGIPASNFSKYVKTLVEKGLVERYKRADNRKEIILLPTGEGRALYRKNSEQIAREWQTALGLLDAMSPADRQRMQAFFEEMARSIDLGDRRRSFLKRV